MLAVKFDDLSLTPTIYMVDGENPSDVYMHTMAGTHLPNTPIQTTTFFSQRSGLECVILFVCFVLL